MKYEYYQDIAQEPEETVHDEYEDGAHTWQNMYMGESENQKRRLGEEIWRYLFLQFTLFSFTLSCNPTFQYFY